VALRSGDDGHDRRGRRDAEALVITRKAKVHAVTSVLEDASDAFSVRVTFDESASTVLRLSAKEHADLAEAVRGRRKFSVTLHVDPEPS
jgi:hypothetical protein